MGGIHPRWVDVGGFVLASFVTPCPPRLPSIKSPVGRRLAQAFLNRPSGGAGGTFTGPTIAGCTLGAAGPGTLTVRYNASLLRGARVAVSPFPVNTTEWGARDSMTFMACFSSTPGAGDCDADAAYDARLWVPCAAAAGGDGASVVLTLPPPPPSGGVLAALRYAW